MELGERVESEDGKTWIEKGEGTVMLGLTHYGVKALGGVQALSCPEAGAIVNEGESLVAIDGALAELEIESPVDGTVGEVNTAVSAELETLNEDPVEEGWLVKIETR